MNAVAGLHARMTIPRLFVYPLSRHVCRPALLGRAFVVDKRCVTYLLTLMVDPEPLIDKINKGLMAKGPDRSKKNNKGTRNFQCAKICAPSDRIKDDFFQLRLHEIGVPLGTIVGFGQDVAFQEILLIRDERKRYVGIILSEGRRLQSICWRNLL